jgi:predicted amidohydrolase
MGKVAAIQMTSSHIVADNLAVAAGLLREAKDLGCDIACLPENFSFIGLRDADKLQVAEPDGEGAVQSFLSDSARELKMWILGGTIVLRGDTDRRVANSSLLIDAAGRRVARYDKIHLFDVTIPGRDEQYRESTHVIPGRDPVIADTPVGKAGGVHCADRPRALGDAAAGAGHRELVLRGGAGANRHAYERPRDLWRLDHRRLLGTGALAPGKRYRSDHCRHRSCEGSGDACALPCTR